MIHVLDRLCVGNYTDAFTNKFNYTLSLLSDPEITDIIKKNNLGKLSKDICYVEDGDYTTFYSALDKHTETVMYHLKRGFVLIHCEAGMSRSPAFIINILVRSGFSLSDAENYVKDRVPFCSPSDSFIKAIKDYYKLETLESKFRD
jgi:protein-tyrosine phosphatase